MIYTINPSKDTTIYEYDQTRNTGVDQILELHKHTVTPTVNGIKNSRIIMSFDITKFELDVPSQTVAKADLQLWAANSNKISKEYTVVFSAMQDLDAAWGMGTGLSINNPAITNGANWTTRDGVNNWSAAGAGIQAPSISVVKGALENTDINVDITTIYNGQKDDSSNSIDMRISRLPSQEASSVDYGHVQYFSNETKTIYKPQLNLHWDDSAYTLGTNVVSVDDNIKIVSGTAKYLYSVGERNKLLLKVIPMLTLSGYSTSSMVTPTTKVLPTTAYYKITDVISNEDVYDYSLTSTKISCDAKGTFINLWTDTLIANREYSVSVKVIDRGYSGRVEYFNDVYNFRVEG